MDKIYLKLNAKYFKSKANPKSGIADSDRRNVGRSEGSVVNLRGNFRIVQLGGNHEARDLLSIGAGYIDCLKDKADAMQCKWIKPD